MNTQAQTPKPMSFAILRNTHEVFRSSIMLMNEMLERGSLDAFRQEWQNYQRCRQTHLAMEEDAVFTLLDKVGDGAITEAGLGQEHVDDRANATLVDEAVTVEDTKQAYENWKAHQLEHLSHEEKVMGPLTMKSSPTPEGRAQVVHDTLLVPALEHGDFDWYLAFVIKRLSAYGTAGQAPNVAVRVFAWGLQYASSPAQWNEWKVIVRDNTSAEIWDEMVDQFQIDSDGKISA